MPTLLNRIHYILFPQSEIDNKNIAENKNPEADSIVPAFRDQDIDELVNQFSEPF